MLAIATSILLLAIRGTWATISLGLSLSGPGTVTDVDQLIVVVTFTNTGDEALKLYTDPSTALSSFPGDKFTIAASGDVFPEFIGADPMYLFKFATDFVELAPGATTTVSHQLSAAYKFTVTGKYQITVANTFTYQDASGAPVSFDADVSNSYIVNVQGTLVSSIVSNRARSLSKRVIYDSCNSWRTSQIDEAITNAVRYLSNVLAYLNPITTPSHKRYVLWWGTYTADRKNHVQSVYTNITSSNLWTYTYYCACDHQMIAFVYLRETGHVYLCKDFWKLPKIGNQSKGGVLIHEASHFITVGGTGDYARGTADSKALAKSNPGTAIMNADNYEFFAETMWNY